MTMTDQDQPAHLEWWANRSTCLARLPVRLTAGSVTDTWRAAMSPPLDEEFANAVDFLLEASPFFTLCLPDGSAVEVLVEHDGNPDRLRLRAAPGPAQS